MRDRVFVSKGEIMVRFGMAAATLALMAAPLFAQESTEKLKKELEQLRAEVDGLKAVNQTREIPASGKVQADAMAADDNPLMTLLKGTKLSGFIDTGYEFSFNQLNTNKPFSNAGKNPIRIFDTQDNSFYLNELHLQVERLASKDMIVGYHFEIAAGHDPAIYDGGAFGIQEGWVQILAPVGDGIDIRIGKMAMMCGYEVLENTGNMNYSRGMVFGIAQPFTSTGIRASYGMGGKDHDMFTMTLGFSNGFNFTNKLEDNDHGKAVEFNVTVKPISDLLVSMTLIEDHDTGTVAAPLSGSTNDGHYMFDLVVSYQLDKLTLALDYTQTSIQGIGVLAANDRAYLSGIAVYTKYQVTDAFASSIRIEYFSDQHGVLPGVGPVGAGDSGDGARIFEFTLTEELKVAKQLILRFEIRHDDANNHIFNRNGKAARGDNTIGFEAIMPF
jgi:hypothetical protein